MFKFCQDPLSQSFNIERAFVVVTFSARRQQIVYGIYAAIFDHLLYLFSVDAVKGGTIACNVVNLHILEVDFLTAISAVAMVFVIHSLTDFLRQWLS